MATKVFLSSTSIDLAEHRQAAIEAIRRLGMKPVCMEDFGAAREAPIPFCVRQVQKSDAYIGLFGWRYGYVDPDTGKSATEVEYRTALGCRIPLLLYLLADDYPVYPAHFDIGDSGERIRKLRSEIRDTYLAPFVKDPGNFAAQVAVDITRQIVRRKYQQRRTDQKRRRNPSAMDRFDTPVTKYINPHHPYILDHTVIPTKQRDDQGRPRFDVRLFVAIYHNDLNERKRLLQEIDRVVYQLHESNPIPVLVQQNWQEYFRVDMNNWGEFWVRATVIFKNKNRRPIQMIRHLNLEDPDPLPDDPPSSPP